MPQTAQQGLGGSVGSPGSQGNAHLSAEVVVILTQAMTRTTEAYDLGLLMETLSAVLVRLDDPRRRHACQPTPPPFSRRP